MATTVALPAAIPRRRVVATLDRHGHGSQFASDAIHSVGWREREIAFLPGAKASALQRQVLDAGSAPTSTRECRSVAGTWARLRAAVGSSSASAASDGCDQALLDLSHRPRRALMPRQRQRVRSPLVEHQAIWSEPIAGALERTGGARFYRCAFQINPFEYHGRHGKTPTIADEAAYNEALIDECIAQGIEVLAVADHYRVKSAESLWKAARAGGITVFPGFEAVTKDGVHLICLFEPGKTASQLERVLGDCGIHSDSEPSPAGKYTAEEFLRECQRWGALCIAAHVAGGGGLLKTLSGRARIGAWKSQDLHACALPGRVEDAPVDLRRILENKDLSYKRGQAVAVVNASDVGGVEDLREAGASCWIKMSEVSIEGLRQAFLDPTSRIRLASDPVPDLHSEFVAMAWEGGFLDGATVRFNENLNVLIGGRGSGKSTIVESIRYVLGLEPLGDEASKAHDGIVRNVLRAGTKVSLLIRSHRPTPYEYLVQRTVPNPPVVRTASGEPSDLRPIDVVPDAEVYGQHEISELTKSPEKLTRLLDRFVAVHQEAAAAKTEIRGNLKGSRMRIVEVQGELTGIEERLAALPALEERLKRFREAGVEEQLKDRSLLVTEEQRLKTASDRLEPYAKIVSDLRKRLPVDVSFASADALKELPAAKTLGGLAPVLHQLGSDVEAAAAAIEQAVDLARQGIDGVRTEWDKRRVEVQRTYERTLRKLQETKIEGEQFIALRKRVEELRPLRERQATLEAELKELVTKRREFLTTWEDAKTEEFRRLDRAATKVSKKLTGRVRVSVAHAGNHEPLASLLKKRVGGRLSETVEALSSKTELSLTELAEAWRSGRADLEKKFGLPSGQAEKLVDAGADVLMEVEELELPPATTIELNVGPDDRDPVWQRLDDLSTGQKATAVLLLLLLESESPLIVDQPEDDLDNRFITDSVVPKMRHEKRRRQFIFATHNANIPVLGDAELIAVLSVTGEAGRGRAEIPREFEGSIDSAKVRGLVEEILEGGREAFEMRRLKYGF
jgi:energy-coupling factor transporter ATP-binding protein EcfA2